MDQQLETLLKHLAALRENGVTYLKVDGLEVYIAGALPAVGNQQSEVPPRKDPVTYGLRMGTKMPSLRERVHGNGG